MTRLTMWILAGLGGVLLVLSAGYWIASLSVKPNPDDLLNQQIIEDRAMAGLAAQESDPDALVQLQWSKTLARDIERDVVMRRADRRVLGTVCLIAGLVCLVWSALFRGLLEIRERFDTFALYQRMPHRGEGILQQ